MRIHGIPVQPVRFGPRKQQGRQKDADDKSTEPETPDEAPKAEATGSPGVDGAKKQRLFLIA